MSSIVSMLMSSGSEFLLWLVQKASPMIFSSLVEVVEAWAKNCEETENKFDDVFSGLVLKIVKALAGTEEAQADTTTTTTTTAE